MRSIALARGIFGGLNLIGYTLVHRQRRFIAAFLHIQIRHRLKLPMEMLPALLAAFQQIREDRS